MVFRRSSLAFCGIEYIEETRPSSHMIEFHFVLAAIFIEDT